MTSLRPARLTSALLALALASCGGDLSPIVSAEIQGADGSHALSQRQVNALNDWLTSHRSGWGLVLATPPGADLVVVVRREDGKSGSLSFYPQPGWQGALTYFASDPKDNGQGSFAVDQVRALRSTLVSQD